MFDVEGFGDGRRRTEDLLAVRKGLYKAVEETFSELDVEWDACYHEDRGDGLYVLVPAEVDKSVFCHGFPLKLARRIRQYNGAHRSGAVMRLRMALHIGEIELDEHGVTSPAVNDAFRLINATRFRELLRESPGCLALIASSWFYGNVVWQHTRFRPYSYQPIRVKEKEMDTVGWVALPDAPHPTVRGRRERWRVRILDQEGRAHGAGFLVNGRYIITSADAVHNSLAQRAGDHQFGRVWFDLPCQPRAGVREAQPVWRSMAASPEASVAALSVIGPAILASSPPVLPCGDLEPADIVRVRRFELTSNGPRETTVWSCLSEYTVNDLGPLPFSRIAEYRPQITTEYSGADVTDATSGVIIGITVPFQRTGQQAMGVVPVHSIVSQWPPLEYIAGSDRNLSEDLAGPDAKTSLEEGKGTRPPHLSRGELIRLIEHGMQIAQLAEAPSRHQLAADLPPQISLAAPRSSSDRADLAGLFWACSETPGGLAELRKLVEKVKRPGIARDKLLEDLEKCGCRNQGAR